MRRNIAIERLNTFQGSNLTGQDYDKVAGFYAALSTELNFPALHKENLVFIVVAHMLHDLPYLLEGLCHLGEIGAIIPKESQYVGKVESFLRDLYSDLIPDSKQISKQILKDNNQLATVRLFLRNLIQKFPDKKIMILDHGGYFAPCMSVLLEPEFSSYIAGIVEHTLNGEMKYDNFLKANPAQKVTFSLSSIARSATKSLEDKYVTNSIVSSIQHNIYSGNGFHQDFERLNIGIMGFGHMGSGIARRLLMLGRNSKKIKIYDISPEACAKANHFFSEVFQGEMTMVDQTRLENKKIKHSFLQSVNVVICATSQVALDAEDLASLAPNAVVIFVTSPDDLLSSTALQDFEKTKITECIYEFKKKDKRFYSILSSINFLNGSIAHPILHLVFAATFNCILNSFKPSTEKIRTLPLSDGQTLSQVYIQHFGEIECDVEAYNIYPLPFYFVGRSTQLKQLSSILYQNKMGVITSASIEGLGGIGKTTLASQYAWESLHAKRYDYIIRVDASDENALCREFRHLANHLQVTNINKLSAKDLVRKVYDRLSIYQHVLFIFDNASSYNSLQAAWIEKEVVNFLPPSSSEQRVHLIVTTRNLNFTSEQKIELGGLQPSEARDYIQHYLPNASDKDSDRLAALLSYFPLALSQAVAYLEQNKTVSIDTYINNYNTQNKIQCVYLNTLGIHNSSYQATVYTTWNISIAEVAKRNSLALAIINVLPYFDNSSIPLKAVSFLANSEFALQEAIEVLRKYSLIQPTVMGLRMHDLVQTVSRLYQEGTNKRDALNRALDIAYKYVSSIISAENRYIPSFINHANKIVRFHEEFSLTKNLSLAVKVELLYHIGNTEHFHLLFSERAMQAFTLAEQIYSRPECRAQENEIGDSIIWIYIHLANSSAGAGFVEGYINALDKLLTAPGLKVQHLVSLLENYGINANLHEAKDTLLKNPLLPNWMRVFCQNLAPQQFFEILLQDQFRKMWLSDIPTVLEHLGTRQLAIVYLMFKNKLVEAQAMANRYIILVENTNDMVRKIEAHCLLAEANIFAGSPDINTEISRLEKARAWFKAHPNIDQFWFDQTFYILAVLYATAGLHKKSNDVLNELWDHMVRELPAATLNESIKKRIYNLVKLIDFFSASTQSSSDDYKKLLAQTYRLAGRLLTALQSKPRLALHPEAENPERTVIANYFEKSLQFDEDNAATYYDYGRFLYQNVRTHDVAIEKFETVAVLESTKAEENEKIMYLHLGREGANLPKHLRQSGILEQAHANSLYYLACWYLVLINAKQGKVSLCLNWFDLLAQQMQKQIEHPELHVTQFSQGLFAGLQQKSRIATIIKTRENQPRLGT